MNIAVLGTGSVGQALASKVLSLGHTVYMGTRDAAATRARTDKDGWGNPGIGTWLAENPAITLTSFREAVSRGNDLIVFAMNGNKAFDCLEAVGADILKGKVMLDLTNPLDFSKGFPPTLFICNDKSLGEAIQERYPELLVVKSLNTMSNPVMVNPALVQGDHTVFVSGNNEGTKESVCQLLESFGWMRENIIDLGDITTARGTEMILPLWVRLYGKWQTPMFNFSVRKPAVAPKPLEATEALEKAGA